MSYGYDGPEYANYSAYNDGYNKYADPYPDHAKSVYNDPDSTHSEPDHYGDHEDVPGGYEYEHEGEIEGYKLEELERRENEIDEYEEEIHEPQGLNHEGDEVCEYGEPVYKPKHNAETHYVLYEPRRFNGETGEHAHLYHHHLPTYVPPIPSPFSSTPPTPSPSSPNPPPTPYTCNAPHSNQRGHVTTSQHTYMSNNGHDDDKPGGFKRGIYEHKGPTYLNTRTADGVFPRPQLIYHEESGEFVHPCFLTPAQIAHHPTPISPSPFISTPPPPQPASPPHITSPTPKEQGHKSAFVDPNSSLVEHPTDYPATTPSVDYTYLNTLRCDCERETPGALAWIDSFYDFVDICEENQENREADKWAEIRKDHWIEYPKRDYYATPCSWDPANEHHLPRIIEKSRPLYPVLKRGHYKNHQRKHYPNPRPRSRSPPPLPSPKPKQHYGRDNNITPHTPSPPSRRRNKHHINNTPKPPHHVDTHTTPYSTS